MRELAKRTVDLSIRLHQAVLAEREQTKPKPAEDHSRILGALEALLSVGSVRIDRWSQGYSVAVDSGPDANGRTLEYAICSAAEQAEQAETAADALSSPEPQEPPSGETGHNQQTQELSQCQKQIPSSQPRD